jgi:hypothetical protein
MYCRGMPLKEIWLLAMVAGCGTATAPSTTGNTSEPARPAPAMCDDLDCDGTVGACIGGTDCRRGKGPCVPGCEARNADREAQLDKTADNLWVPEDCVTLCTERCPKIPCQ